MAVLCTISSLQSRGSDQSCTKPSQVLVQNSRWRSLAYKTSPSSQKTLVGGLDYGAYARRCPDLYLEAHNPQTLSIPNNFGRGLTHLLCSVREAKSGFSRVAKTGDPSAWQKLLDAKNPFNVNNSVRIEHGVFGARPTAKSTSQWHIYNERPRESEYLHVADFENFNWEKSCYVTRNWIQKLFALRRDLYLR